MHRNQIGNKGEWRCLPSQKTFSDLSDVWKEDRALKIFSKLYTYVCILLKKGQITKGIELQPTFTNR